MPLRLRLCESEFEEVLPGGTKKQPEDALSSLKSTPTDATAGEDDITVLYTTASSGTENEEAKVLYMKDNVAQSNGEGARFLDV